MSQYAEQRLEQLMEQFEAEGGPAGMEDPLQSSTTSTLKSELAFAPTDVAELFALVTHLQAEQASQQNTLSDMQQQIDLQRLATAELASRCQSSSSTIAKFEQVALNTVAAAEQLEAEIIGVCDTCNFMREGASGDMAAFRTELTETRSQHYVDIAELCASFANKADQPNSSQRIVHHLQASDGLNKNELNTIMEARDHALRDQMAQALEAAQEALSRNFLEEHAKLLVEFVEDREKRQEEAKLITSRLDAVAAAHNIAMPPVASSNPNNPSGDGVGTSMKLDSMREAIQELRVNMIQDASGDDADNNGKKNNPAKERGLFEELAMVRKDITSCLDAANAAVRLGEHLTKELHIEAEARCSDILALRVWAARQIEAGASLGRAPRTSRGNVEDPALRKDSSDSNFIPQLKLRQSTGQSALHEDQTSVQDNLWGYGTLQSPSTRSRDLTAPFRKVVDGMQERLASLGSPPADPGVASVPSLMHGNTFWSSQHTLMPAGGLNASGLHSPGIMLSGGTPLAQRQQNMPAGDRYLANQRLASSQLTLQGGPPPAAPGGHSPSPGLRSPRQPRMPSPIQNYHLVHGVQRVEMGQAIDPQDLLRRQQASPLREPPLTGSQHPTIVVGSSASFPCGTAIVDSSRRVGGAAQMARSHSPVHRQISAMDR